MPEYCPGKKSKPINIKLYDTLKKQVKTQVKKWPSAYASAQLVNKYKKRGGKYHCKISNFGKLDQWFREKWVDVCSNKICGRKLGENRSYPYCRPSKRINNSTPRTKNQLSKTEILKRCNKKHKIKGKTLRFGKNKLNVNLNLTNNLSINLLRKSILNFKGGDCQTWNTCKTWIYIITNPINSITDIKYTLRKKKFIINKNPSKIYSSYIKKSKGNVTSFRSPSGTLLIIPRKPYINLIDFAFNSTKKEWTDVWRRVAKESKKIDYPFYISTHGHGVNWLHIRLEKRLKYR